MKRKVITVFTFGMIIGIVCTLGAISLASNLVVQKKNSSRVVIDNEQVRVKEAVFMPGDRRPGMHTHEYAHVGVPIDAGTLRFTYPDGKTETAELKPGAPGFRGPNVTHEAVNIGNRPLRVIEVEIKK